MYYREPVIQSTIESQNKIILEYKINNYTVSMAYKITDAIQETLYMLVHVA